MVLQFPWVKWFGFQYSTEFKTYPLVKWSKLLFCFLKSFGETLSSPKLLEVANLNKKICSDWICRFIIQWGLYRVFNFLHNLNIGLCPTCIKKIIFVGQKIFKWSICWWCWQPNYWKVFRTWSALRGFTKDDNSDRGHYRLRDRKYTAFGQLKSLPKKIL